MPNFVTKFIDARIEKMLEEKNLCLATGVSILVDEDYVMQRNKMFYNADTNELFKFFKVRKPKNRLIDLNLFYNVATGNLPLLHYNLGCTISKTMANLVFSNTPVIDTLNDEYNDIVKKTFDENNMKQLLQKAVEYASYSGCVAFKPIIDKEFSEYPMFIPYPKEDIDVIRKYDRVTDIIFKDKYKVDKEEYTLFTICGKGYMKYKLYKTNSGNKKEVPINSIEETAGLKDVYFYTSKGVAYNKLLAVYVENKTNAKSDYDNLADDFAALDEIYSNMIDFIRKSRIKTYMPESLMNQDMISGKKYVKSEYDTSYITLYDSNPAGTNVEAKRDIVDVNSSLAGYKEAFNNVLLNALSSAGLSPCSCGFDMSGANSSALALNIRERVSLRTREEKQSRWFEALQDLVRLIIGLYTVVLQQENAYIEEIDTEVSIKFAEYESPTFNEQVDALSKALDANLISLSEALKMLYPDRSEAELDAMQIEIEGYLKTGEDIENAELDKEDEELEVEE